MILMASLSLVGCGGQDTSGRWVKKVTLQGVNSVEQDKLLEGLATQETPWWWWIPFIGQKNPYRPRELDKDIKRIEAYYQRHGFFAAKVRTRKVEEHGKGAVDIQLDIKEGPSTKVNSVLVDGKKGLPEALREHVFEQIPLKVGERYSSAEFWRAKSRIESSLRNAGYAYAKVEGKTLVNRETSSANVQLKVSPGPLVHFGKTIFQGNGDIPTHKLRWYLDWKEGDLYEPDKIQQTRVRLLKEKYFSSVLIDLPPRVEAIAPITVKLDPLQYNELRLGMGLLVETGQQNIQLNSNYVRRNFFGGMRTLSAMVNPAFVALPNFWQAHRFGPAISSQLKLTQPDLFGLNILGYTTVGYDLGIHEGYQYHGLRLRNGIERYFFHDYFQCGLSWNFEYLDYFNIDQSAFDRASTQLGLGFKDPYRVAWLEELVRFDYRDQMQDPRKGVYAAVLLEQGFSEIASSFRYTKVTPEARGYLPLGTTRLTLALRALYGRLDSFTGDESPITRRYYLGGPTSQRGFGYNRLSPVQVSEKTLTSVPMGGVEEVLFSAGTRLRVMKIAGYWLGLNTFLDAGDVVSPKHQIDLSILHLAVGGELQYQTPIGPVRFSIGVRLNRLSEMTAGRLNPDPGQRVAFHLTLGDAF